MSLYRGYCHQGGCFGPCFPKKIKIFPDTSIPAGARHRHPNAPYIPFFRFRTDTSLSGLLPGMLENGPCFLKKISIFSDSQRHNPQIPDDRHGWNSPPLISEKMRESVRGQCNFSEKSSGDSIPLYRGYRHPGVHFGPCFSKKIEKFFTPGQDQILRTAQQKQNKHTLCFLPITSI